MRQNRLARRTLLLLLGFAAVCLCAGPNLDPAIGDDDSVLKTARPSTGPATLADLALFEDGTLIGTRTGEVGSGEEILIEDADSTFKMSFGANGNVVVRYRRLVGTPNTNTYKCDIQITELPGTPVVQGVATAKNS